MMKALAKIVWLCTLCTACNTHPIAPEHSRKKKADIESTIAGINKEDSLTAFIAYHEKKRDRPALIVAYKVLGKRLRENARFSEALNAHRKGLEHALNDCDTNEIIQAYNNIGTDFRRMGGMSEAANHHYRALSYSQLWNDTASTVARKNQAVSLNGIGNIHLTLGEDEIALRAFRQALQVEQLLNSHVGQAINYANIGSIFESRGEIDSAHYYYRHSMLSNQAAHSTLGIALCHNHFGRLAEKKGAESEALKHYMESYNLMKENKDRWHWLEACIALARVHLNLNRQTEAMDYLTRARQEALHIKSPEHLAIIHQLGATYYRKKGNYRKAMESYNQSVAYADSVRNEKSKSHLLNLQVNYERAKAKQEVDKTHKSYRQKLQAKQTLLFVSILMVAVAAITILLLLYAQYLRLKSNRLLRRTVKMRSTFFTNITHEFRTPLTVVTGLAEQMLAEPMTPEEREQNLQAITRQSKSLLNLVNQLLKIAKGTPGNEQPKWVHADLSAYLRLTLDGYRDFASSHHIRILFSSSHPVLEMDFVPEYVHNIMNNLMGNALKFTHADGSIYVDIARKKGELLWQISDTGDGIPADDLPHIFELYYQGSNSHEKAGTGIGLPFVKQMVESMRGSITVENNPYGGATFTIRLPMAQPQVQTEPLDMETVRPITTESAQHVNAETEEKQTGKQQPTILIVEDNQDITFYLKNLLKKKYAIFQADNGTDALEIAAQELPDLILTDLMMTGMDGYTLCQEIRKSELLNHIPIIIITAKSEEADRIRGLEAGADAYLLKPFNAEELHVRIKKLLNQRQMLRDKYSQEMREGNEPPAELRPAEREFMNRLTEFIHAHISEKTLNAEQLADKCCMSKSQLNRKIRAIAGYSTAAYILQIRLEKAKRLLATTEQPISDISMLCGFEDTSYFARVFKQLFKVTPSLFRKTPSQTTEQQRKA